MGKWQECDCDFADPKGGYESCPGCGTTFREEPAADEPVDEEAEAWALFEKEAAIDADLAAQPGGSDNDH